MNSVRPRRMAFRGSVEATGILISRSILGESQAIERILKLWEPGAQVWSVAVDFLVRFGRAVEMRSETAPGLPVVAIGKALSAVPLSSPEWEQLQPPANTLIVARDGIAQVEELRADAVVDPALWIELGSFAVVTPEGLGAPVPAPIVTVPQPIDLRRLLPGAPVESAEAQQLRRELREQRPTRSPWLKFLEKLRQLFTPNSSAAPDQGAEGVPSSPKPSPLLQLLHRWMWKSPLARWLGDRYARYFSRLLRMFSEGDLDAALRHAIPLSEAQRMDAPSAMPSLEPRSSLSIQPVQKSGGGSFGVGAELFGALRHLYRQAFERLSALQRVDEAAFVLAELLEAHEEAVAFLESHGRLRLAAELAEGRGLKPELVVRQWMIAGDVARAVRIARRSQAFPTAIALLERSGKKEEAMRLRQLWAASLANDGNFAGAVDACWPHMTEDVKNWMRQCIRLGGPASGRMLARWTVALPNEFEEFREIALRVCEEDSDDGARVRVGLASELAGSKPEPVAASLARLAVRGQIRDIAAGRPAIPHTRLAALIDTSGDRCLRWDRPTDQRIAPMLLHDRTEPLVFRFDAHDTGASELEDAVLLPNGQVLVALGERGAALLNHDGRTLASFTEPAYRLVVSAVGTRAIALAPRGSVWRLARIDLALRKAEHWREAKFTCWAPDYANGLWYVGDEHSVYAIDTQSAHFDAFWSLPDIGGAHAIARSLTDLWILTGRGNPELWRYELPSHTLRNRDSVPHPSTKNPMLHPYVTWKYSLSENGQLFALMVMGEGDGISYSYFDTQWRLSKHVETPRMRVSQPLVLREGYTYIQKQEEGGITILAVQHRTDRLALRCRFEGASRVSVFAFNLAVTMTDNLGRLVSIEMETGTLVRNFRL